MDRRAFMAGVVASAVAAACSSGGEDDEGDGGASSGGGDGSTTTSIDLPPVPDGLPDELFTLGVASGDPLPDSVILWTRLVSDPLAADGGMVEDPVPVEWQIASDEDFAEVVISGGAVADQALAHSVHIDAQGLEPDTWYWYRFTVGDKTSPVGRTRTTPAEDDEVATLRFAFASCQEMQSGHWAPHKHLADEDIDLVLFLGDYIYEGAPDSSAVRTYASQAPHDLATYRQRWSEYKSDPVLQGAHAQVPWVCTWDDHEVENNYANDVPGDGDGPSPEFLTQRAAAYQAFYEHLPLRVEPPEDHDMRIYRQLNWGDLVSFFVLDSRQHRSDQADCPVELPLPVEDVGDQCEVAQDESRTLLGTEQEEWLAGALQDSQAQWNVLAQQIVMTRVPFVEVGDEEIFNLDQWDGYPAARRRMVEALRPASNPVVITGDIHLHGLGVITDDPDDPGSAPLATELVGTSISSEMPLAGAIDSLIGSADNIYYANGHSRGYVVCEVTRDRLQAHFRTTQTSDSPDSPIATDASWVITSGDPVPTPV